MLKFYKTLLLNLLFITSCSIVSFEELKIESNLKKNSIYLNEESFEIIFSIPVKESSLTEIISVYENSNSIKYNLIYEDTKIKIPSVINDIELIQMSILYDYSFKYEEPKYKLIDYIIFDLKNISTIKDAIRKFPYTVNYLDSDNKSLILKVIEEYIKEVNSNLPWGISESAFYNFDINARLNFYLYKRPAANYF